MLCPLPSDWNAWGIQNEVHQFFSLHWTELFDRETPDTWQVRSCNVKTVLQELIDAAAMVEHIDAYRGVMRSILDEAFAIVKRDEILRAHFPFVSDYLEPWREGIISEDGAKDIAALSRVILGNLDSYWEKGVKLVLDLLAAANGSRKKDLYSATMNLAVETSCRGFSPRYLRNTFIDRVLVASDVHFVDRVASVLEVFAIDRQEFDCTFLTEGLKHAELSALPTGLTISRGTPENVAPGAATEFHQKTAAGGVSVKMTVVAADPYVARRVAEKCAGEIFAAKNLFDIEERFGIKTLTALVECKNGGDARILELEPLGATHLGNYKGERLDAQQLFRVHDRLKQTSPTDAMRLGAAMEYHRLAISATSDEARLMNLWIAVEALCQGSDGSIIERVWTRIAPCVAVENVRRTMVSLAIYVKSLWTKDDREEFLQLFPNSTPKRLVPSDLLQVLTLPDQHPDLVALTNLCARHPLILHRLFRIRSMVLDCPGSIKSNLEFAFGSVEWQLKRIYRVRNAIVHSGASASILPQLTQHLHCYLVMAIRTIVTDLDRQELWTIKTSLDHQMRLFEHLVKSCDEPAGWRMSVSSLLNPEASLSRQISPYVWPAKLLELESPKKKKPQQEVPNKP